MGFTRRTMLTGAIGLAAAGIAGCSTSTTPTGATGAGTAGSTATAGTGPKKYNLQVMGLDMEMDKELLGEFLADKEYGLTWIQPDPTTLNAMLAAGSAPDLVRDMGALSTAWLAKRGLAHPLDDFIAQSEVIRADDLAAINDVWRYDGNRQGSGALYGIAKDYSVDSQWWMRTDMAEPVGVTPPTVDAPWSMDELVENCAKMTKREGDRIAQYGMYGINVSMGWLQWALATHGGSIFNDDFTELDLSSPEARQAIQWLIDTSNADVGYSPLNPNPDGWDWPAMAANRLATAAAGYWFVGTLAEDTAEPFRDKTLMLPTLTFGPQRVSSNVSATGYWMPEQSKHKEAAFELLEFTMGGADGQARARSGWGLPTLKSLESELPTSQPYQQAALESVRTELEHLQVLSFTPYAQAAAVDTLLAKEFLPIAQGSKKADDYVANVTPKVNELLAEGRSRA